jgi:hypothetical protein
VLTYIKRPSEAFSIGLEWASKLPTGVTLSSGIMSAVDRTTGADVTGDVLASPAATVNGTQASFTGIAGASPTDYLITQTVTLSDGSVRVQEVLLQVRLSMLVVATAGAANANSYATLIEADSYHKTHLYNTDWITADDWKKESALIWATRLLDEQVEWEGYVYNREQALRWPRSEVSERDARYYFDNTTIPTFLKQATAELARHLLAGDRTQERSIGIQSVTADTVAVVFDKHDVKPILPPSVRSIVEPYGRVKGPGSGTAELVRT